MSQPFGYYTGRSIGRLLNLIAEYTSLTTAESVIFEGEGRITLRGELFAIVTYDETEFPIFEFHGPNAKHFALAQDYKKDQVRRDEALMASLRKKPETE